MTELTIITNNHPRDLACWHDLPATAQADFEYIQGEDRWSPRLFQYRGFWYDTGEFTPVSTMGNWQGGQSDSCFSGVLIRYCNDFEQVIAGRYFS